MRFRAAHLPDDDLLSLCLDVNGLARASVLSHLDTCAECTTRRDNLQRLLETVQDELFAEADEAWPADRLAHQRDQIRRRLESAGRQARVLEFPAISRLRRIERPVSRLAMRWIAAAAVVGLLVGVGAGVLIDHRSHQIVALSTGRVAGNGAVALRSLPSRTEPGSPALTEDQFLSDVEAALEAAHAPELQALDDFTPRIQEVAVNLK